MCHALPFCPAVLPWCFHFQAIINDCMNYSISKQSEYKERRNSALERWELFLSNINPHTNLNCTGQNQSGPWNLVQEDTPLELMFPRVLCMGECAMVMTMFWQRQLFHLAPYNQVISDIHPQHSPNQSQKLEYAYPLLTSMASNQTNSPILECLGHVEWNSWPMEIMAYSLPPPHGSLPSLDLAGHSQMLTVSKGGSSHFAFLKTRRYRHFQRTVQSMPLFFSVCLLSLSFSIN